MNMAVKAVVHVAAVGSAQPWAISTCLPGCVNS